MYVFFEVIKGIFLFLTVMVGILFLRGNIILGESSFWIAKQIVMPGYLIFCGLIIGYLIAHIYLFKMIKKIGVVFLMILLSGCSSSQTTTINFDNLNLKLQSSKSYIEKIIDKSVYPGMIIYQESGTNTKDTFINSLIITSQKNLKIRTKDFANKNIESLKSSILPIVIQSTKIMSFTCSGEKIIGIIKDFKITENKKDSFFSQFFFIDNNDGYIISFQSDNIEENSDFKNSLSKLSCTK